MDTNSTINTNNQNDTEIRSHKWALFPKELQPLLKRPLICNSLQEIITLVDNNIPLDYLLFWGHQAREVTGIDRSCLSQWFPRSFKIDGVVYKTIEHYMMASKARLFDPSLIQEIINTTTAKDAKSLGRKIKNFDAHIWDDHVWDILVEGNIIKFTQNQDLKNYLIGTLSKVIVEASPYDKIYGIGMRGHQEGAKDPKQWKGKNILGFALMKTRSEILKAGSRG